MTTSMKITSHDGLSFDAYVAQPGAGTGAVVIVIQEIFGINAWLRSVADMLAGQGFIAVAPDLFHRQEPGIQLDASKPKDWERAFELYGAFDENDGVEDLKSTVAIARKMAGARGKIGTMGFCLGGKLAFLMSARSDADANVGYYGVGIEKNLDEPVKKPLMLQIAEADKHVGPEQQKQIKDKLSANPLVTLYTYPGMDHAFTREGGEHYDEKNAKLAHERTFQFLKNNLG